MVPEIVVGEVFVKVFNPFDSNDLAPIYAPFNQVATSTNLGIVSTYKDCSELISPVDSIVQGETD